MSLTTEQRVNFALRELAFLSSNASNDGPSASSGILSPITDFGVKFADNTAINALTNGQYYAVVTGADLDLLGYSTEFNTDSDGSEIVHVAINVSAHQMVGSKLVTFTVLDTAGHYSISLDTDADTRSYRIGVSAEDVNEVVSNVYVDMANSFSRMGYSEGAVVEDMDGLSFTGRFPAAASGTIKLHYMPDGSFTIKGGDLDDAWYWLPYGDNFVHGDYQVKRVDVSGVADVETTVGTDYGNVGGGEISFTHDSGSGVTGQLVVEVYFIHNSTGIETMVTKTIIVDLSN